MNDRLRAWRDFIVFLIVMFLLMVLHREFPELDAGLRFGWVAFAVAGSVFFIFRVLRARGSNTGGQIFWLPRKWQLWILGEKLDKQD